MMKIALASLLLVQAQADDLPVATVDSAIKGISGYKQGEAPLIGDDAFLKRLSRDLLGAAPTEADLKAFVADVDPKKRAKKIDQLVLDGRFDEYWAQRFTDVFFGDPTKLRIDGMPGVEVGAVKVFERWLREQFRKNVPWTEIVSQMLVARGALDTTPEAAYVLSFNRGKGVASEFPKGVARHFLGIRMVCAECHDNPYDKWRVEDYYGLGALIVRQKATLMNGGAVISYADAGEATIPKLPPPKGENVKMGGGGIATPSFLFGGNFPKDEDRMKVLAGLMTLRANTQLPRALVNRVWGWLMGWGIVSPVDDFNLKNKALSPALMEVLTRDTIEHGYSVKRLVRLICNSANYQMALPDQAPGLSSYRQIAQLRFAFGGTILRDMKLPVLPIAYVTPEPWTRVLPRNLYGGAAKVYYRIPDPAGDLWRSADLWVYEGKSTPQTAGGNLAQYEKPKTQTTAIAGVLNCNLEEVTGIFLCRPGSDGPLAYAMLTASLVTPADARMTFRLEGPADIVAASRGDFIQLLKTAAPRQ